MTMRTDGWLRALAVAALLVGGCSSPATGNGARTTPTVTTNPTPTIASQQTPCTPGNRCLALVALRGSDSVVVRDITDIIHPKTISNLGTIPPALFVSATDLSYGDPSSGVLYRTPLAGLPKTGVGSSQYAGTFAWSPNGSTVVYTVQSNSAMELHQLTAPVDRVLGSVPAGGVGGCEAIESCALANSFDFRLLYSPDGAYISLVATSFGGSVFRLWSSDGKLVKSSDSPGPTMSAWSGSSLYFRDAMGVEVWRNGAVSPFLPGVTWIKPKASPGGSQIAYVARDSSGWAHTYVVDTATKKVRELRTARTDPVFLTPRYLWYQGERACVPADICGPQPPFHPLSGKTYIYDLEDDTETESIITRVYDVWPHAA